MNNPTDSLILPEFTRISVIWKESGYRFPATVVSVDFEDGSYEVLYDEYVRNKPCFERHVSMDRIELLHEQKTPCSSAIKVPPISAEFHSDPSPMIANDITEQVTSSSSSSSGKNDIFSKLKQIADGSYSSNFESIDITTDEIYQLQVNLTVAKMDELLKDSPEILQFLSAYLYYKLSLAVEKKQHEISVIESFEIYATSSESGSINTSKLVVWLHPKNTGGLLVSVLKFLFVQCDLLIRIHHHHHHSDYSDHTSGSHQDEVLFLINTVSSDRELHSFNTDDALKLVVGVIYQIIKRNVFWTLTSNLEEEKILKPKSGSFLKRIFSEMAILLLPQLESILNPLLVLLSTRKQSDVEISPVIDFCMLLFKIDTSPYIVINDVNLQISVHSLQKCTINILTHVFKQYQSHRPRLIMDIIQLMVDIYGLKQIPYTYSIISTISTSSSTTIMASISTDAIENQNHITMILTLLLRFLQSTVMTIQPQDSEYQTSLHSTEDSLRYFRDQDTMEASNGSKNSNDSNAHQLSLWKQRFMECRKYCGMFVSEVLKRCSHKEVSSEYRTMLVKFVDEILVVINNPLFSVSSILLEVFVLKLQGEILNSSSKLTNGESSTKRDTTYITFLLDIVGTIGCQCRRDILFSESKSDEISLLHQNTNTSKALEAKLTSICVYWNPIIRKFQSSSSSKSKTKSKSKSKLSSHDSIQLDSEYGVELKVLSDVMNAYFSAITEIPSSKIVDSSMETGIPSVETIISNFSSIDDFKSIVNANTPQVDVESFMIIDYLQYIHEKSSLITIQDGVKDSTCMLLLQWLRHSLSKNYHKTFKYIENLFQYCIIEDQTTPIQSSILSRLKLLYPVHGKSMVNNTALAMAIKLLDSNRSGDDRKESNIYLESSGKILAVYNNVVVKFYLHDLFEGLLNILGTALTDSSPIIRARVVKTFHSIIKVDHRLFLDRNLLKNAITDRLHDIAISVREETVKLLGYMITLPTGNLEDDTSIISYLQALRLNLYDPGISVRKSVVQIFRDILTFQRTSNSQIYVDLCITLLERWQHPKEEASIKELIMDTFQRMWFLPIQDQQYQENLNSSMLQQSLGIPTNHYNTNTMTNLTTSESNKEVIQESYVKNGNNGNGERKRMNPMKNKKQFHHSIIFAISLRLLDVVIASQQNQEWMIALIRGILHSSMNGDEGQVTIRLKRDSSLKHCNEIIESLLEILLKCEEGNNNNDEEEEEKDKENGLNKYLQSSNQSTVDIMMGVFLTLSVFCEAHPPFLLKRLPVLLPYLKGGKSNRTSVQDTLLTGKLCEMISSVALLDDAVNHIKPFATEVAQDLVSVVLKTSASNINVGVKALCLLSANILKDVQILINLSDKCFNAITAVAKTYQDNIDLTSQQIARIQRCLPVLGAICAYSRVCTDQLENYEYNNHSNSNNYYKATRYLDHTQQNQFYAIKYIGEIDSIIPSAIHGCCYSAICFSLSLVDPIIQSQAVQALCSVFIGCPKLILLPNSAILLNKVLSDEFSDTIREKLLISLKNILDLEEVRLEENAAVDLMKESGVAVGDRILRPQQHEGDTTIAGFVLQQHLTSILSFLFNYEVNLRRASLGLIGTMLRQGMICPLDVISHLIGLQTDPDLEIRQESLRLLQQEDQKHPNFVDNRMIEGIELAFILQMKIYGRNYYTIDSINNSSNINQTNENIVTNTTEAFLSIFGPLYSSCIQSNRKRRNDMLLGLLKRNSQILHYMHDYSLFLLSMNKSFSSSSSSPPSIGTNKLMNMSANSNQSPTTTASSTSLFNFNINSNTTSSLNNLSTLSVSTNPIVSFIYLLANHKLIPSTNIIDGDRKLDSTTIPSKDYLIISQLFLKLSTFIVSIIAYLPFEYTDEPQQIIYWINRNISISTGTIITSSKQCLLSSGAIQERLVNEMQPPAILGTNKQNVVSHSHRNNTETLADYPWEHALVVNESYLSKYNMEKSIPSNEKPILILSTIKAMILRGLEGFLRLKSYLKVINDLSDEKCALFRPDDKVSMERLRGMNDESITTYNSIPFHPIANTAIDINILLFDIEFTASKAVPIFTQVTTNGSNSGSHSNNDNNNSNGKKTKKGSKQSSSPSENNMESINPVSIVVRAIASDYNRVCLMFERGSDDFTLSSSSMSMKKRNRSNNPKKSSSLSNSNHHNSNKSIRKVSSDWNGNKVHHNHHLKKKKRKARFTLKDINSDEDENEGSYDDNNNNDDDNDDYHDYPSKGAFRNDEDFRDF